MILDEVRFLGSRIRHSRWLQDVEWLRTTVDPAWHHILSPIYARRGLSTHVNGDAFSLDLAFGSPYGHHDSRVYEPEVYEAFIRTVRPGMCVFDIGADIGLFTLAAAKRVMNGHVFAFEPNTSRASTVERHVRLNRWQGRVTVVPAAVADCEGRVPFYITVWTQAASLSRKNAEIPEGETLRHHAIEIQVESVTLDRFCEREGVTPDVLKIDVEGAELRVLRGGRRLLTEGNPVIFCEVHPLQMQNCGSSLAEFDGFLVELGYTSERLDVPDAGGIFHTRLVHQPAGGPA